MFNWMAKICHSRDKGALIKIIWNLLPVEHSLSVPLSFGNNFAYLVNLSLLYTKAPISGGIHRLLFVMVLNFQNNTCLCVLYVVFAYISHSILHVRGGGGIIDAICTGINNSGVT
jgi:hypothetical protein